MLDILGGAFAPKPSSRPHKLREYLPLVLIMRNWLKYALIYHEVAILMQHHVLVDVKGPIAILWDIENCPCQEMCIQRILLVTLGWVYEPILQLMYLLKFCPVYTFFLLHLDKISLSSPCTNFSPRATLDQSHR